MNAPYIISKLGQNGILFRALFDSLTNEEIDWRISPEKWNIREIACHLLDEEREDFRARLKHVLETPALPLPPIDPAAWVQSRNYASRNFQETVQSFLNERKLSIAWLNELKNPPLDNAFQHPKFGPLSGNLFLSNWLAHDFLHFRQIVRIKYEYLKKISGQKLDYAGEW